MEKLSSTTTNGSSYDHGDGDPASSSDDEYCVYTYKGEGSTPGADLPSSFYEFQDDMLGGAGTSGDGASGSQRVPHLNSVQNNGYSPDMDFLEMDFDPGGESAAQGDEDEDDESGPEVPAAMAAFAIGGLRNQILPSSSSVGDVTDSPLLPYVDNGSGASSSTVTVVKTTVEVDAPVNDSAAQSPRAHCSRDMISSRLIRKRQFSEDEVPVENVISKLDIDTCHQSPKLNLRLVKSTTHPEIKSVDRGVSSEFNNISVSMPVVGVAATASYASLTATKSGIAKNGEATPPTGTGIKLDVESVMIWTFNEALEKSISQIGVSACGATAVSNVLKLLGYMNLDSSHINTCVKTRLRDEGGELPEYLYSRSVAGTTHEDLIAGVRSITNDNVVGRFFGIKPTMTVEKFSKLLLHWICRGAIPVVTRNLQQPSTPTHSTEKFTIPDSWHHQMVFGVTPRSVYLSNPVECLTTAELLPQLSTDSVLLVRRNDVTGRFKPKTDLRRLAGFDSRWSEMNVLGQVGNMLLEEEPIYNGSTVVRRVRTSHIKIPAAYTGGVTVFLRKDSEEELNSFDFAML